MRYLKKSLSLMASALGVLLLSGFLSLRPIAESPVFAHHTDPAPNGCFDIPMTAGKTLTDPGSPDSGRLDFNAFGHDYQACLLSDLATDNSVKGWVWNTNVGYISMSCQAGDNLGASCGGQNYGVTANPTDGQGANDGRVRGFAWGDNIGWISMGCDANGQNMGVACGGVQYGVRVAKVNGEATCLAPNLGGPVPVQKDDAYGYAWSDSLGWINFCGAHFYLFDDPPVITTAKLTYQMSAPTIYANGEDYVKIIVQVENDGVAAVGPQPASVSVEALDFTNTLKADQIAGVGSGAPATLAPTSKNDFVWDAAIGGYVAYVRAIAPTDLTHLDNFLRLNSVTVKIAGVNYVLQENNKFFDFNPAITVTKINSDAAPGEVGDSLFGILGSTTNHQFTVSNHLPSGGNVLFNGGRFFTQIHDCSVNPPADEFNFSFGANQSSKNALPALPLNGGIQDGGVCNSIPPQTTITDMEVGGDGAQGTRFLDLAPIDATTSKYILGVSVVAGNDPSLNTTTSKAFGALVRVSYSVTKGGAPLGNVAYISHKTTDSSLVNQAADVRGNVRIDTQKIIIADNIQKSIGEAAQSKREPFYRAIKQIATATETMSPVVFSTNGGVSSTSLNGANNLHYYKRAKNGSACKLIITDGVDISPTKSSTIIGEGCDIYIDKNIRYDVNKKQLGLVALEDVRSSAARRGGNVYVCSTVTDISGVHIVADGAVMSYSNCGNKNDNSVINQADGLPVFPLGARTELKNQLTITGSIISNNTYGGSVQDPPVLGDGTKVSAAESYKARLQDVNFLRYANTTVDINGNECWDGSLSPTLTAPAAPNCANNNPLNSSIVNVRYQAPATDLPVFGTVGK